MGQVRQRSRTLSYLLRGLILAVLGLGLPTLWLLHVRAGKAVAFDSIAALPYERAIAELDLRGSRTLARFDGERADAQATGLPPGEGIGINPRFVNIGANPGAIYHGESGTWFLLGRFRVLDYGDGEWHELGIVENSRFRYRPQEEG